MSTAVDWTPKARAVLTAAGELFYAHGIHAVGVDAIAERAGVTKKTLYDRFGSKERLVVEYLRDRDAQWRAFLAPRLEAAGSAPERRLAAVFDASAAWSADRGTKGCGMINAHAEISDPAHPAYAVIVGQKQWMLQLFTELVAAAGAEDQTARLAEDILLLHEGALVTAGIGVLPDAFARARDVAVNRLAAAVR
ncbi:TetR/AcrR family transcriptional regulator [Aeromicrobium phragmitis]|uniref:TetR/AcrR family transcriptional regulator n=1 Tax=Aeromicrobium phragmitis TaxID=2478914 RepID=A0A3L8PQ02_9ACTN|nr:TetR/AcrR family transcriptional regulator [Aeromicrobium phragmitis]RLV57410.1 TetR/AcrR family transcriptional regulator [Aeromicrobium phragmitis]